MRAVASSFVLVFLACETAQEGETPDADTRDTSAEVAPETGDASDTVEPDTADTQADGPDGPDGDDVFDSAAPADASDDVDSVDTGDTADTAAPPAAPAIYLTVTAIPPEMNGSRAAITPTGELPFRLRVNRADVELDVIALPESGPFGAADLTLTCLADGEPHALPSAASPAPGHLQIVIDQASAFPDGAEVVCTASITTAGGSSTSTLAFDAAALPPALDPFPAPDEWLVLLRRDTWALDVTDYADGTAELLSDFTSDGDGVDDFDAPFFELGLLPASDPAATTLIRDHLLGKLRTIVQGIYGLDAEGRQQPGGVNLRLYFEGDPGAPDPADYGTGARRFSMIALTGDGDREDQLGGTFGRAMIDWNNQDTEDDTVYGLGVWPAAVARAFLRFPAGVLLLREIRPALGGTPFGLGASDALFIGQDIDNGTLPQAIRRRADLYKLLVQYGSLALASILAHEIGHSLGLVPFGAPPEGLFAGVETDWLASFAPDAHIDTAGLNVMQTGGSVNWLEAATGGLPRFEPLSWAYLRRQLVVGRLPR